MFPPSVGPQPVFRGLADEGFVDAGAFFGDEKFGGSSRTGANVYVFDAVVASTKFGDLAVDNGHVVFYGVGFGAKEHAGVLIEEFHPMSFSRIRRTLIVDKAVGVKIIRMLLKKIGDVTGRH